MKAKATFEFDGSCGNCPVLVEGGLSCSLLDGNRWRDWRDATHWRDMDTTRPDFCPLEVEDAKAD